MKLFVDTSAFVALIDEDDNFHQEAKKFAGTFRPHYRLNISNFILDEAITRIRMKLGHSPACQFIDDILNSKVYRIHRVGPKIEKEGIRFFKKYNDKRLSFTDCTSFVLMKYLKITTAFTFDDDFAQVGFTKLPNF